MGCYLEDYRVRVGTWAGRFLWHGVPRRGEANRNVCGNVMVNVTEREKWNCDKSRTERFQRLQEEL
jgi:hypothetical protein